MDANILSQKIKVGNFQIPLFLLLLLGAALMAVIALSQKNRRGSGSGDGSEANALVGLYDAAINDIANQSPRNEQQSFNVPPSAPLNPSPTPIKQSPTLNANTSSTTPTSGLQNLNPISSGLNALNEYLTKLTGSGVNLASTAAFPAPQMESAIDKSVKNTSIQSPNAGEVLYSPSGVVGQQISIPYEQLPRNSRILGTINGANVFGL